MALTTFTAKSNNAKSVITDNPLNIGATTLHITGGTGTRFPATGNFYGTLWDATTYPDPTDDPNMEYVLAVKSATDTYTISATTKTHAQGSAFRMLIMKENMDEYEAAIHALEQAGINAASPISNEVPTGAIDGSNTVYTTAAAFAPGSLKVYVNRTRLNKDDDYTEASDGTGFTMTTAIASGSMLRVDYYKTTNWANIGTNSFVVDETPAGTMDGSNTAFTVLKGSYIAGSLKVSLNGQILTHTGDYTETTPGSGTFAMVSAPASDDVLRVEYQYNQNAAGNADTVDGLHADQLVTGWSPIGGTLTYSSVDGHIFVATTNFDATLVFSPGMRIKLTQTTVKYFIVHAVAAGSVTLYGGTDYTLANAAITNAYVSGIKAPLGFPLNETKWTETLSSALQFYTQSPTNGTWYRIGAREGTPLSIDIPIGVWRTTFKVTQTVNHATVGQMNVCSTLSTTTNSETDTDFSLWIDSVGTAWTSNPAYFILATGIATKTIVCAAKTTYYPLHRVTVANINAMYARGDYNPTLVKAVDAYL